MSVNVDEILKDFEPAFRKRLEHKVFETAIEGFAPMRPFVLWCIPLYAHLTYIAWHSATHGGSWVAWMLTIVFSLCVVATACLIFIFCSDKVKRTRQKFAENCGCSIAEFQRMAEQFPDRKKKQFLKDLERNLKEAAAFMA